MIAVHRTAAINGGTTTAIGHFRESGGGLAAKGGLGCGCWALTRG